MSPVVGIKRMITELQTRYKLSTQDAKLYAEMGVEALSRVTLMTGTSEWGFKKYPHPIATYPLLYLVNDGWSMMQCDMEQPYRQLYVSSKTDDEPQLYIAPYTDHSTIDYFMTDPMSWKRIEVFQSLRSISEVHELDSHIYCDRLEEVSCIINEVSGVLSLSSIARNIGQQHMRIAS